MYIIAKREREEDFTITGGVEVGLMSNGGMTCNCASLARTCSICVDIPSGFNTRVLNDTIYMLCQLFVFLYIKLDKFHKPP